MDTLASPKPTLAGGSDEQPRTPAEAARATLPVSLLLGLALLAGLLRIPTLPSRQVIEGDGVHYAILAVQLLDGDLSGAANPYWSNLWPVVIAATRQLSGLDVVMAGRLASLLSGIALAPLTATLAARLLGTTTGSLAGLAVAVHPWLAQFSTLVFTESFFSLLLIGALLAGERMLRAPGPRTAGIAGCVAAAALLTRPEAYGAILLIVALLGVRWWRGQRQSVAGALLAFTMTVTVAATGRTLLVHRYFGEWDFGIQMKGTANLLIGLAADDIARMQVYNRYTAEGENTLELALREWSLLSFTLAHPGQVLRHVLENLVVLGGCARRVFPPLPVTLGRQAFPGLVGRALDLGSLACFVVALVGLAAGLRARTWRCGTTIVAAMLAVYLLGLAPLFVHERMIVAATPLFLVLFAHGLGLVGNALQRRHVYAGRAMVVLWLPLGLLTLLSLRVPDFPYAGERLAQKQAGLWLRAHFSQETVLMTPVPSIAFYFYDDRHHQNDVGLPWGNYGELMAFARQYGAGLVAAPDWQLEAGGYPCAANLLPSGRHPGLTFVTTVAEHNDRVHIFAVDPPLEQ
jgi:hypothetical protein